MPVFPRPSSPRAAFADLRAFLGRRSREQAIGGALALLITFVIVVVFFLDASVNTAPPAQVIFVESYAPTRTDAEIIADQKERQALKEAARKARQAEFQKLQDQLGIE
jgi:ethanolamine utilization microcompartment shell protein EutL